jgi:hypothetical protein
MSISRELNAQIYKLFWFYIDSWPRANEFQEKIGFNIYNLPFQLNRQFNPQKNDPKKVNALMHMVKMKKSKPTPHKIRVIIDRGPQYILKLQNYA